MREVKFYGIAPDADSPGTPEIFSPLPASWPDSDARFEDGADSPRVRQIFERRSQESARLRAICFSPETDWDMVRVAFDDEKDQLLVPGQILHPKNGDALKVTITPAIAPPMFRGRARPGVDLAAIPATIEDLAPASQGSPGITLQILTANKEIKNVSGQSIRLWRWLNGAWSSIATIANNAVLIDPAPPSPSDGHLRADQQVTAGHAHQPVAGYGVSRSATYKPRFGIADYISAGVILMDTGAVYAGGGPYVMASGDSTLDENGNPISAVATTVRDSAFSQARSSLWVGRLALELWRGDAPPAYYRPKLAPERYIHFGALTAKAEAAGADPTTIVAAFPMINVQRAQFTYDVPTGSADVFAAIGSPLYGSRPLDMVALAGTKLPWVREAPITVTAGNSGAAFHDDNSSPYGCVSIGSPNGGQDGSVRKGAVLTLVRRERG